MESDHHSEAHSALYVLPSETRNIDELLDIGHASKKPGNRKILLTVLQNVRFLARQGLPLRGDGPVEDNSNFMQLLQLRAQDNPQIHEWLKRKNETYTSKDIQNEMIKLMAHACLREISSELHQARYYTIMADETTDSSNNEQLVTVFRCVDESLQVHEEFVGLYQLDETNAETIVKVLKDVVLSLSLDLTKLRGQCYDGASTMSGAKSGVAKRILDEVPTAFYTHCYGHALNLAASDTIKKLRMLKNAMDTTHEITKLIKFSPKRDAAFQKLKGELQPGSPGVRVLCPTRWTVRADALKSILDNFTVLQELWELSYDESRDTEIRARIQGVAAQMSKFEFYYAASLAEMILRHTDNLSKTLQRNDISAAEGQKVAQQVRQTLQSLRGEIHVSKFWKSITAKANSLDVSEPTLPRKRIRPSRYEDGDAPPEFSDTAEHYYRVTLYNEAIDLIVNCLTDRFDQPGYKIYSNLEQLLLKGCRGECHDEEMTFICQYYTADIHVDNLEVQLTTLSTNMDSNNVTLETVVNYLQGLSSVGRTLYSEVCTLVKLILVMPASNVTSERSFSALRRVKTYLRSTMTQVRLNNLMVVHVHKDRVDKINLSSIGNEFIDAREHRKAIFGKFP